MEPRRARTVHSLCVSPVSDTELGLLNAAFTVAFAVAAIPIGYWADRGSRRMIIGDGVAIWSLFTLLTGLTQSFAQMLA